MRTVKYAHTAGLSLRFTDPILSRPYSPMQFEVNALGPLRVVSALQHALAPGAKVAIITSQMGSLAEATKGAMVRRGRSLFR